jgi:hypothetical protein
MSETFTFAGKVGAYPNGLYSKDRLIALPEKYLTRVEVIDSDKHSSLLRY